MNCSEKKVFFNSKTKKFQENHFLIFFYEKNCIQFSLKTMYLLHFPLKWLEVTFKKKVFFSIKISEKNFFSNFQKSIFSETFFFVLFFFQEILSKISVKNILFSHVLSATSVAKRTLRIVGLMSGCSLQQS